MNYLGCVHYSVLFFVEMILAYGFSAFSRMQKVPQRKKIYLFLALGILALMTMFRDSSVGNDTQNYIGLFRGLANADLLVYIRDSVSEPGFLTYAWILTKISRNYQVLFIVSGAFVFLSIGRFLFRHVDAPGIVCISMVALMKFDFFLSAQRQAIAVCILLWAYDYVVEKRTIKFLILAALATTFHYSSLVFIVTYFLANSKIVDNTRLGSRFYIRWVVIVGALMVFFPRLMDLALRLFPKYRYYIGSAVFDGKPRLAWFLQSLMAIIMFFVSVAFMDEEDKESTENRLFAFFSIINISLLIIASNAAVLTRFCSIYTLFPVAQYSVALSGERAHYRGNQSVLRLLTLILFFFYGFVIVLLRTPQWYTTYPFKFR